MSLTKDKIKYFKEKLEEEKKKLTEELASVGKKNPDVQGDWEVSRSDFDTETSDTGELSNAFEEMENRSAVEDSLEVRLANVNKALGNIEEGIYGQCGVCKKPIEIKRLEANPAATECVKHADGK